MKTILHLLFLLLWSGTLTAQNINLSWSKQFAGPGNQRPRGLVVDYLGNSISYGSFDGIADFDPNAGSAILSSAGMQDGYIVKINPQGDHVWSISFGAANDDIVYDLAFDGQNNLYVTGEFRGTVNFDPSNGGLAAMSTITAFSGVNAFVAKYNPDGDLLWVRKIGGSSQGYETGYSIDVDISGNVVSTGRMYGLVDLDPTAGVVEQGVSWSYSMYIQKLTSAGEFVWARNFVNSWAVPNNIKLDATGQVYTTGIFYAAMDFDPGSASFSLNGQYYDSYILKLNSQGNFVWARHLTSSNTCNADDMEFDEDGNLYIVGGYNGNTDFNPDLVATQILSNSASQYRAYLLKLNDQGLFQWVKQLAPNGTSRALQIERDNTGKLYIAGTFSTANDFNPDPVAEFPVVASSSSDDIFITVLDENADFLNAFRFGGTGIEVLGGMVVHPTTQLMHMTGSFAGTADLDPTSGELSLVSNGGADGFLSRMTQCAPVNFNYAESACDSYVFNGGFYTESGIYEALLVSQSGCDSLVTVDLTINYSQISDVAISTTSTIVYNGILYTQSGVFIQDTVTTAGCDSTIFVGVIIFDDGFNVTVEGDDMISDVLGESYQWVDCNNNNQPIPGATQQAFTPTQSGNYAVIVNGTQGSAMSECVSIVIASLSEREAGETAVYPNPCRETFFISGLQGAGRYELHDVTGKLLMNGSINTAQMDVSSLPAGSYLLSLFDVRGKRVHKLIKE
jgi:hypothetical protein